MLVAAATDVMDGYIARKRREITTLGILLDPIADKLLISAAFISLVEMGLMQAWMVVIIIGREFMVMGLREIASVEGLIIPASPLGKTKMILQVLAGCAVILTANHPALKPLGTTLLWLVVISAVVSAMHYFQMFWSQINLRVQERRRAVLLVNQEENSKNPPLDSASLRPRWPLDSDCQPAYDGAAFFGPPALERPAENGMQVFVRGGRQTSISRLQYRDRCVTRLAVEA